MTQTANHYLDADELLHLAIAASERGKSEEAITLLKRALALAPDDARLHYLLGAEHAQIGLYERAVEEIRRAVELDPEQDTAHFQLGLLYCTSGRAELAAEAWKPLDKLNHDHFLYHFKTGLLHLINDEFAECDQCLRRGILANKINAALNDDMTRILRETQERLAAAPAKAKPAPAKAPGTPGATPADQASESDHILLSAYRRNRADKDNER
ncbi:MAG TPA: tetratricopeptide repeat protein [Candidatus Binatia bacterium]|nr:tetratricopeptide repeat protein [Candidatus Binatia bacterium]